MGLVEGWAWSKAKGVAATARAIHGAMGASMGASMGAMNIPGTG